MNLPVTISIPARLEELAQVEEIIESLYEEGSISDALFGNLMVACTEAVLNAIHHGSGGDSTKDVMVSFSLERDELSVVVQDTGKGFDFNNLPDPTDPDRIEEGSGRGVFIMKNLADEVLFEENGARVTMSFSTKEQVPSSA